MKDSKGRKYDGWTARRANGRLIPWCFERTRTRVLDRFQGRDDTRRDARNLIRRWGYTIVKVRLVEVGE